MWLLHLLPESLILALVYLTMLLGIAGILVSSFLRISPFVNIYRIPLQLLSTAILAVGIYWYGGYSMEMLWRDKVAQLEKRVKESEEKSKEINKEVQIVYRDKVKVVKQDVVDVQEIIKEVSKIIDSQCVVAPEAIAILNNAAKPVNGTVPVDPLTKESKK